MPVTPYPIEAPAVTEPQGLATAVGSGVIDTSSSDQNWTKGYSLEGEVCGVHDLYILNPACEVDDVPDTSIFTGWQAAVPGGPVVIGAGVRCSSFSSPKDLGEWHAKADRRLEVCRWSELANELWTGAKAKLDGLPNRYLASFDADLIKTGTALSPINGIAEMDASFRTCSCGGQRVIHVPVYLIDWLSARSVIERRGMQWFTAAGSMVVSDDGYPGTGPDIAEYDDENPGDELRAAPGNGQAWIYGTQQIVVKWGDVMHPEPDWSSAMRYRDNYVEVRSEQFAMATWLCCHLAALIDTTIAN